MLDYAKAEHRRPEGGNPARQAPITLILGNGQPRIESAFGAGYPNTTGRLAGVGRRISYPR